jgi:hypothetical protein
MTPVVILIVDIRTFALPSPSCSTLPHLFYFEPFPVAYVTVLVVRVGLFIDLGGGRLFQVFTNIINVAQVSNLALSLLTNVSATSIIAVKSWYVRSILNITLSCILMTHACAKGSIASPC